MSSPCLSAALLCLASLSVSAGQGPFRVCADPDNLPFSNQAAQGFENRIAELLAADLHLNLEYFWYPQTKSFISQTLVQRRCDVVIGLPAALDSVLTTEPYYTSTWVFVSRSARHLGIASLTDARLAPLRIGIQIVGDGYAPPAAALTRRGLSANLIGFPLTPGSKLIEAVAVGDVDIAVAWGPPAAYYSRRASKPLEIVPVTPAMFMAVPFTYPISAGVRIDDTERKTALDAALRRQCASVQKILTEYGVPQSAEGGSRCDGLQPSPSALLH